MRRRIPFSLDFCRPAQPPLGMIIDVFLLILPNVNTSHRAHPAHEFQLSRGDSMAAVSNRLPLCSALVLVPCIVLSRARGRVELDTNLTRRRCEMSCAPPSRPSFLCPPAPLLVAQILPTPHSCSNRRRRVRRAVQLAGLAALANMH